MRYRDGTVRVRFRKHTSRRNRKLGLVAEKILTYMQPEFTDAMEKAALDLLIYGESSVDVSWDSHTQAIRLTREEPEE